MSHVESCMRSSTVELSFSQTRGTPARTVGETSRRFWKSVSGFSTKLTTEPACRGSISDTRFS